MAVFIAASDETVGADHRSPFMRCGFLAPENDWSLFAEQWESRVLAGPPRIPYLHMTDIRSREWRDEYKLTETDADRRVDEAFAVIAATPSLTPMSSGLNSGHMHDTFTKKVMLTSGAKKRFWPDYLAFPAYAHMVLCFCHMYRPDAEKVDFIVERNGQITDHIKEFYAGLPIALQSMGLPQLIPLMGEIIPAGKGCVPLQAADALCWHTNRSREGTLDAKGAMRYAIIGNREGFRFAYANEHITEIWDRSNESAESNG
jgi:hypothetical protein